MNDVVCADADADEARALGMDIILCYLEEDMYVGLYVIALCYAR